MDNVVTYVYAKVDALVDRRSDDNTKTTNTNKNSNKNNVGGARGPVPGSKVTSYLNIKRDE